MKRDLELIRALLKHVEEGIPLPNKFPQEQVLYHIDLCIEKGLIDGQVVHGERGQVVGAVMQKLTWEGHDFVEAMQNDSVWRKVMAKIGSAGGAWTIEIVKALLRQYLNQEFGLPTGS